MQAKYATTGVAAGFQVTTPSWAHWCPHENGSLSLEKGRICACGASEESATEKPIAGQPVVRWSVISDDRLQAEVTRRGLLAHIAATYAGGSAQAIREAMTDRQLRDEAKRRGLKFADEWPHRDEDLANDLARANNDVNKWKKRATEAEAEANAEQEFLWDVRRLCERHGIPDGKDELAWLGEQLHALHVAKLRAEDPPMSVPASIKWPGMNPEVVNVDAVMREYSRSLGLPAVFDKREHGPGLSASMPESKPIDPSSWPDELDNLCDDAGPKR